jgi:hypothetical protein
MSAERLTDDLIPPKSRKKWQEREGPDFSRAEHLSLKCGFSR